MTEPSELETKSRSALPSPMVARRCRIPRLSRSSSVRTKGDPLEEFSSTKPRPLSLILPSSKAKEFSWQFDHRFPNCGSVLSVPFHVDDDRSSLKSFGSFLSYNSYASQSQNTEASSRPVSRSHGKKYVLHCERNIGPTEEYLTPTQRKEREIRQLKSALLHQAKLCEDKQAEIERLKSEIERLHDTLSEIGTGKNGSVHSSQGSDNLESLHDEKNPSEISFQSQVTDKSDFQGTIPVAIDDSGISNDMSISPRNSSEFDDVDTPKTKATTCDRGVLTDSNLLDSKCDLSFLTSTPAEKTVQVKNFVASPIKYVTVGVQTKDDVQNIVNENSSAKVPQELENFLAIYQRDLEQLKLQHKEYYKELKDKFNDQVDDLLKKLSEANSRYFELRPMFDRAQDKIHSLESQLTGVQRDMENQEEWHNQMYLKMYRKGQEAARFEHAEEVAEFAQKVPKRASVPDLLRQLHQLEAELDQTKQLYREASRGGSGDRQAEYTLRFLKDAVFYFLTKKDKEHLKAIQSILGFTDAERMAVSKAMKHRRLFCTVFRIKK